MSVFDVIISLFGLTALLSYINVRFLKLPETIGLLVTSLLISLGVLLTYKFTNSSVIPFPRELLSKIDFNRTLMQGMLSFLLFAGAMHLHGSALRKHRRVVLLLSTVGVIISTIVFATAMYLTSLALDLNFTFNMCLLWGALISPTDPIAVLSLLKRNGVPKSVETIVAAESLFNDGIGLVLFTVLYAINFDQQVPTGEFVSHIVLLEVIGGIVYGYVLGWIAVVLLGSIDDYKTEVLLTLGLVSGGYALADVIHTSGPLAMVVAGLIVGNRGRSSAMSEVTLRYLDTFWEIVDWLLNAVLFVLIGLEVFLLTYHVTMLFAGIAAILAVVAARWLSIRTAASVFRLKDLRESSLRSTLFWGGLRGGISIALVLSLPPSPLKETMLGATYIVVIYTIVVQGLLFGRLLPKRLAAAAALPESE
jgi:CPA1 family monovalent cation:H+ antiporter